MPQPIQSTHSCTHTCEYELTCNTYILIEYANKCTIIINSLSSLNNNAMRLSGGASRHTINYWERAHLTYY